MKISSNNYSIAEILDMLKRRDLTVNTSYQRGTELWPSGPRSYFIDTIFAAYPFPKIYFYEDFDDVSGRTRREIVDGQQRVSAIEAFSKDEFALADDHAFGGHKFSDLDDEAKRAFLQYVVAVDVIRDATQAEIVEMFRRMNAYTLPLNEAEKRHAAYQGPFKWTMLRLSGDAGEFFSQFGVFTNRQMVRMADQELLAETFIFTKEGLYSSSPALTNKYYKAGEFDFPESDDFSNHVIESIQFIAEKFPNLRKSFMMKPYAFYTLLCALIFNRYGTGPDTVPYATTGRFAADAQRAEQRLLALANAHEAKETQGPYRDYVAGCSGGTNRLTQRTQRFDAVMTALQT
ncbi:DUF262 domain-containing protein [Brevundimonas staleyi]|uniref:DUF262 domain-containing protein n=1 Tax=Brevundimonas staleyi TaxID=74326 RepID=A0ABW0FSG1_9CAUL